MQVTNDDIAGFCGISTRNSVNRILRGLREENVIRIVDNKILILNADYLKPYADLKGDCLTLFISLIFLLIVP